MVGGAGIGGGIGGAIGGAIGLLFAGEGGEDKLKEALRIWDKLELSNFDMRSLSPPEIRVFAEAFPEQYDAVIRGEPVLPEDSAEGRDAQLRGLARFEQVAREGLPTSERLAVEDTQRQLAAGSRSLEDEILTDLAARGRLGAGDELAARMAGASASQNAAAAMGRDLAQMKVANRLGAAETAAGMGSRLRAQDIDLSSRRADAMNRFNELASQLGTQAARDNALARERAQAFNVGTKQRTGEEAAQARYGTELENLTRQNALKGASFGQSLAKTQGQTGALTDLADLEEKRRLQRIMMGQSIGQGVGQTAGGLFGGF